MQMHLTVQSSTGACDVAVDAPPDTTIGELIAQREIVATGAGQGGSVLWTGDRSISARLTMGASGLRSGMVLSTSPGVPVTTPGVLALEQTGGPAAGRLIALARDTRIVLGRSTSCDVVLDDSDASRHHAEVRTSSAGTAVVDLDSTNGTTVNGRRVPPDGIPLGPTDVLRVGDCFFAVRGPGEAPAATRNTGDGVRRVQRPPRWQPQPAAEITFPVRPAHARPRGAQWVAALMPALAGGALAWWAHSPQFLLFACLSPIMMLSSSFGERLHWRRSRRRAAAFYARERARAGVAMSRALRDEAVARRGALADPARVGRIAALPGSRLWERRRADADTLVLRVGTGTSAARTRRRCGTDLRSAGSVAEVPVAVDLRRGPLGIGGPARLTAAHARWLLTQVAVAHAPEDVDIVLLLSDATAERWRWARWLPHVRGRVATDAESRAAAIADLSALAVHRRHAWGSAVDRAVAAPVDGTDADGRPGAGWKAGWVVVLVDCPDAHDLAGLEALLADGAKVGLSAVCIAESSAALPGACASTVLFGGPAGSRAEVRQSRSAVPVSVVLDLVESAWAESAARALCSCGTDDASSALPDRCGLLEALELDAGLTPDALRNRWGRADGGASTTVGFGSDGRVELDLVTAGPHALVAGTTGSGKSEFLQTLVAGLAANYPPDRLAMLLIDYKGGAAFSGCIRLPHSVGLLTDLDPFLTERALRALAGELRHRERLFATAGVADLPAYQRSAPAEPVPRLVIVVDEFASLAEELPDFVRGLVGIAQRGRSLGVHLVLATQRPGAAVSPEIRANTTLRVALRVTDPHESTDVIADPAAAAVPRSIPGRAYLRDGSSLIPVQTGWCGYISVPPGTVRVDVLDEWLRSTGDGERAGRTDLDALVDAASAAADGRRPPPMWLEPLQDDLPLGTIGEPDSRHAVRFGITDLPDERVQSPSELDLAIPTSLLCAGSAGSGKTTLLVSVAIDAVRRHLPHELHVHVIDGDGRLARTLKDLPHVGTVLGRDDAALVPRLLRRLSAPAGVAEADVRTLLLIDSWGSVLAELPDADALDCADLLTAVLRAATATGMTCVLAGDRAVLAPRTAAHFDHRLLLRLNDVSDYVAGGLSVRNVPTMLPPGRGVWAATGDLLQVAHSWAAWPTTQRDPELAPELTDEVHRRIASAARESSGSVDVGSVAATSSGVRSAIRIRALPRSVQLDTLPRAGHALTLGVGGDSGEPVTADLFGEPVPFLVSGPARSGRSTVLCSLMRQAVSSGRAVLVAAPTRSPLREAALAAGLAVLEPTSKPPFDVSMHGGKERPGGLGLLLVDDCETFADTSAGDFLLDLLRGDRVRPIAAAVAGRSDDLATSYRGLGAYVRRGRCGLLLRPSQIDGELLGVRLPRRTGNPPPGRGVVVGDPRWGPMFGMDDPVPIQVALP